MDGNSEREPLRTQLVRLVVESSDSEISLDEIETAGGSLRAFGYSSLSYIRLIDRIENDLGVYVDPNADAERFATIDSILDLVIASREDAGV